MAGTVLVGPKAAGTECQCQACWKEHAPSPHDFPFGIVSRPFIVCGTCGNKRCPHAADHRNKCTGSNEPGQTGSSYA
jgi:hypothetical protein